MDFLSYEAEKNNEGLVSLYAKNQHQKINENISKIAIKNGCGKKRLGLIYQRYLLDLGYDITETRDFFAEGIEFDPVTGLDTRAPSLDIQSLGNKNL